jgi:hypothetical protein
MNHEYFLIIRRNHEVIDNYSVIDKIVCNGIREAEKEFLKRNKKGCNEEFIIVKSERWIQ